MNNVCVILKESRFVYEANSTTLSVNTPVVYVRIFFRDITLEGG